MNYNEILPFWAKRFLKQPTAVYRMDAIGGRDLRYYLTISERHQIEFYPSVTSIIGASMPTPPFLTRWIAEHGIKRANELRDQKADYGKLLHIMIGNYLTNPSYNLSLIPAIVRHYVSEERLTYDTGFWAEELKRDLLSFHVFAQDFQIVPLAVEMALVNDEEGWKYGGAIDLVCEATIQEKGYWGEVYKSGPNKGQPKETSRGRNVVMIIDFKSGRHGFYESNEIQANMYLRMWNNNFPDNPAECCYNWRPKEWTGDTPTYEVKDQTGKDSCEQIPLLISIFNLRERQKPQGKYAIDGIISLGKPIGEEIITWQTVEDIARKRHPQSLIPNPAAFTPEQEEIRAKAGVTDESLREEGLEATMQKINDVLPAANLNEEPIPTDMPEPEPEPQTFIFDNDQPMTPQEAMSPTLHSIRKEMRKNGVSASQPF